MWAPSDPGYDATNLYRNTLARYFLPSTDEWRKAAYYDAVAQLYYDDPTGSDSVPDGISFPGDAEFDAVFFDEGLNLGPNVINDVDLSINDDDISLCDAIEQAPPNETIDFASSLNGAKINLLLSLGEIASNTSLTLDASALPLGVTIDAGALADPTPTEKNGDGIGIFNITGGPVTLKNLTLTGGDLFSSDGGAVRAVGDDEVTLADLDLAFAQYGLAGLFLDVA